MRIAIAQLNYHIGHFELNTQRMVAHIQRAKKEDADIIVFAELAIPGYPPRDFLDFDHFIQNCQDSLETLARESNDIGVVVGCPTVNPEIKGKNLFNSACFLSGGSIHHLYHKALLPTYDVFDEYRYFEQGRTFQCAEFRGKRIALTVCEDLWNIVDDPMYILNPMDELINEKPDLIINIAASPFHDKQAEIRHRILHANVEKYSIPLVYVNHVGGQTELLFDGGSGIYHADGSPCVQLAYFEEDFAVADLQKPGLQYGGSIKGKDIDHTELIHDALVMGVRDYFAKLSFNKAILGLSGGIDSAVTLVLAARALGPENVRALLLPSQFSSQHSIDDARKLAENLGCPYDIIPIESAYKAVEGLLEPHFHGLDFNVTEENIQARLRAVVLMALSNKFGYILLNTSNKSEAAVGYGTLYGDMCGGISVLGDIYKTGIYELANYINRDQEIIPQNTIDKPPSAELRPGQKDSDSLPEYSLLDAILFEYIENNKGPDEIIAMNFDEKTVTRVLKLVNTSEYKRYQTPPILRVSPKAFGMGRRMPIVAKYLA